MKKCLGYRSLPCEQSLLAAAENWEENSSLLENILTKHRLRGRVESLYKNTD